MEMTTGQSVPDFVSKCSIALKEARETGYWLRLLSATSQQLTQELTALQHEADEISRVIGSIVVKTKHKKV
jgi:four helix bundle protein